MMLVERERVNLEYVFTRLALGLWHSDPARKCLGAKENPGWPNTCWIVEYIIRMILLLTSCRHKVTSLPLPGFSLGFFRGSVRGLVQSSPANALTPDPLFPRSAGVQAKKTTIHLLCVGWLSKVSFFCPQKPPFRKFDDFRSWVAIENWSRFRNVALYVGVLLELFYSITLPNLGRG